MIYKSDPSAIRDAKEKVDDTRYEIQISQIEKTISKLEEARDTETDAIDDMISKLNEYKDAWNNITSAYVEKQEDLIAAQILGSEWETDILNVRLDVLDDFKNQYIDIQQAIVDAAWMSANEQVKAAKEAEKGASGATSNAPAIEDKYNYIPISQTNKNNGYTGRLDTAKVSHEQSFQKYGTGTNNAKKGLNLVGEDGTETYFDNHGHVAIVTEPTLIPMEGGEVVKNEKETRKLLDSNNLSAAQYGKAFADGTGKYEGPSKAEKNALVSEYGQTEMTVLPNGDTIITDEPTLMDLPKDTVIYNEEQTKQIMNNKVDASGKAHTDGTVGSGNLIETDEYTPYNPDLDPSGFGEILKKWDAYIKSIDNNVDKLTTNAMYEHSRQMQEITNHISNNTSIINSKSQPNINVGGVTITCPGVTDQEVVRKIHSEVNQLFSGLHNYADQWSRR